jgi:type II secretory pathway pseudopilin PulG
MESRLAKLRSDSTVIFVSLGLSALIVGSLVVQKMSATQSDKQAKLQQQSIEQQQQAAQVAGLADTQRRAAIEANAQAWKAWQAHIDPKCNAAMPKIENRSYIGYTIGPPKRLVYEGLIVCDKSQVGILKGADLRPLWLVPRVGSKHPMPTTAPPPEFNPPPPISTVQ